MREINEDMHGNSQQEMEQRASFYEKNNITGILKGQKQQVDHSNNIIGNGLEGSQSQNQSQIINRNPSNVINMMQRRAAAQPNESMMEGSTFLNLTKQNSDMVEDFHAFMLERMNEPLPGVTGVFTKITPATE